MIRTVRSDPCGAIDSGAEDTGGCSSVGPLRGTERVPVPGVLRGAGNGASRVDIGESEGPRASLYCLPVEFRDRLIVTLRAVAPVLEVPGVMIVGSEVPNLLEPGAAASLVVSQDVDVGVPIEKHAAVKQRLAGVVGLAPSPEEPSVWVPVGDGVADGVLEVNFLGIDAQIQRVDDAYVFEDAALPLMVFGPMRLLSLGEPVSFGGLRVPVPRLAGLVVEKLLGDRTGIKGERDLLVVAGLLSVAGDDDLAEIEALYLAQETEQRWQIRSSLTVLSLASALPSMPDPVPQRGAIKALLTRLERGGSGT